MPDVGQGSARGTHGGGAEGTARSGLVSLVTAEPLSGAVVAVDYRTTAEV